MGGPHAAEAAWGHDETWRFTMRLTDIYRDDARLLAWSAVIAAKVAGDHARYGPSLEQSQDYQVSQERFAGAMSKCADRDNCTRTDRVVRDEARRHLVNASRDLVAVCEAFPAMTDEKRSELNIPIRDRGAVAGAGVGPRAGTWRCWGVTGHGGLAGAERADERPASAAGGDGVRVAGARRGVGPGGRDGVGRSRGRSRRRRTTSTRCRRRWSRGRRCGFSAVWTGSKRADEPGGGAARRARVGFPSGAAAAAA